MQFPGQRHQRSRHRWLVVVATLALLANAVATALSPVLVSSHPTLLILLDARNRHLVLAAGAGVGAMPFFLIGAIRGLVFDPVFFALGRTRRTAALGWLRKRSRRSDHTLDRVLSLFERWGPFLLFLSPNTGICLIAGISKMRWRWFLLIDAVSTTLQVTAVWLIGSQFRQPLGLLVEFVGRNAMPLTVVSSVFVIGTTLRRRMRRSRLDPAEASR